MQRTAERSIRSGGTGVCLAMRILEAQRVVEVVVTGEDYIRAGGLLERRHHLGVVLLARAEAEVMPAGDGASRRWCRPSFQTEARNLRLGLLESVLSGWGRLARWGGYYS